MTKTLLNKLRNVYVFIIGFSIVPLLYLTIPALGKSDILELLFWIALEIAADLKNFRVLSRVNMDMTISFAVQMSATLVLGIEKAVFVIIIATIIVEAISANRSWQKVVFNAGQYGLSLVISGYFFYLLKLSPVDVPVDIVLDIPAITVFISIYFLLNSFFITAVVALTEKNKFTYIFKNAIKVILSNVYALAPIGIAAALLYKPDRPYIIFIMIPPVILADQALKRYYNLRNEATETLRILADTLDQRDRYTSSHSANVAEYAAKIAEKFGMSQEDVNEIEMAGHVHDLGKVGIPDSILNKNGKLLDEEYDKIKEHPYTAYRLLKNLKPYQQCAKYVLYHHERIDGLGYPDKLDGSQIPLGARILSVADSYDAMTTDRPYRKALSQDLAIREMRLYSGRQFDPDVVEAFISILKRDYGYSGE